MSLQSQQLFGSLPTGIRQALLDEYSELVTNFFEGKWRPAELHAGRFCEVVYTVLNGRAEGTYPANISKPDNFLTACRSLENKTTLERGLRILASRILPALYEIRNNRDVGHVGGDVDPNFMDSSFSISAASWLLAELVRVFHNIPVADATKAVNDLTQLRTPAVWVEDDIRRVLDPKMKLRDQCLLLTASAGNEANFANLIKWTEAKNISHLRKIISELHRSRLLEAANPEERIRLLPAGANAVQKLLAN